MPETSIVIKAEDRYSDAVKAMSTHTRALNKDVDALEDNLYQLSRNKVQLRMDTRQAMTALREAERQFQATGDAADGLKLEMAQANYDNIKRNLDLVTRSARDTERQQRDERAASHAVVARLARDDAVYRALPELLLVLARLPRLVVCKE